MTEKLNVEIEQPEGTVRGQKGHQAGVLTSKTDLNGIIEYANDEFINISGYDDYELIAKPHSIIRHPDMPKVIFKILWDNLTVGNSFQALIKNKSKSGGDYWVMTHFESGKNETGEIIQYFSTSTVYPRQIPVQIELLYKNLVEIENTGEVVESEKYLSFFLNVMGKSYIEYINKI